MIESESDFDIRNEVTADQLNEDETKTEEEQRKIIEHIKKSQEALIENEKQSSNETKEDLEKEFNRYKTTFSSLIKEFVTIHEDIDHITVQIEISLRKKDCKLIEKYNEEMKEKRLLLKIKVNELNNNIYNNTTTIVAKLLQK